MKTQDQLHIMLDLETLGTKPGCKILSIGASTFLRDSREGVNYFDQAILVSSQDRMDQADERTLEWWNKQSQEAKDKAFNSPHAVGIIEALISFTGWVASCARIKGVSESKIFIWGKGATFDLPILEEACVRYCVPVPWTFRGNMCYRTLEVIGKLFEIPAPELKGVKHSALDDAINQANYATLVFNRLSGGR